MGIKTGMDFVKSVIFLSSEKPPHHMGIKTGQQ